MSSTKEIYREVLEASNRRSFLRKAGLAGMVGAIAPGLAPLLTPATVEATPTPSPDLDLAILNFALNLEYLEAEFYLYATTGKGISDNNGTTASGDGKTAGGEVIIKSNPKVPFSNSTVAAYATEIAQDEFNHVKFLQTALGAAAVASPDLDLQTSFTAVGQLASVPNFDPFADDLSFLLGAFIFEDVGVTAYHGASPLIYDTAAYIPAASGILAVEAFHAAEVRAILFQMGQEQKAGTLTAPINILDTVNGISQIRDSLDNAKDKDQGITSDGTSAGIANIVPTDKNGVVFSRTTNQVLRIVYGMATGAKGKPQPGTFFPSGMNGVIR